MKPAIFEYHDPTTLAEALDLLGQLGEEAKALAGGQSLVPAMNFRLARPANLVDLNRIPELSYLRRENGTLVIGAMTRQREVELSSLVQGGWPLVHGCIPFIAHVQIRNRGTVGGSLAHADPAAELPAVMAASEAEYVIRSKRGQRMVKSDQFFVTYMTTCLEPDELLVEVRVPSPPPRTGWGFQEVSRRHGDFALVGAAVLLTLDEQARISRARIAFTGAGPVPQRGLKGEELLVGKEPSEQIFREAGEAASEELDPDSDIHASAIYRKEVGAVMVRRALVDAAARVKEQGQ